MSDKCVRELVRTLLLDMTPAEVVAHVALELGFRPPLLMAVAEHPPLERDAANLEQLLEAMQGLRSGGATITPFVEPLVVASDEASSAWGDVWVALSSLAGLRAEPGPAEPGKIALDACGQAPCPRCSEILTNEGRVCRRCERPEPDWRCPDCGLGFSRDAYRNDGRCFRCYFASRPRRPDGRRRCPSCVDLPGEGVGFNRAPEAHGE